MSDPTPAPKARRSYVQRTFRDVDLLNEWADVRPDYWSDPLLPIGSIGYLIRYSRPPFCTLSRTPGRTNSSHEERVTGWLGHTNGVSVSAEGRYRVVAHLRSNEDRATSTYRLVRLPDADGEG